MVTRKTGKQEQENKRQQRGITTSSYSPTSSSLIRDRLLLAARYLLLGTRYSLLATCYSLLNFCSTCCLLSAVCCLLSAVCSLLCPTDVHVLIALIQFSVKSSFSIHVLSIFPLTLDSRCSDIAILHLFAFGALNFKANPLTNYRLTGWWCFVLILSLLLLLVNSMWGFWRSDDIDLPAVWRYKIAMLFLINAAVNTLYEFVVFPLLVRAAKRVRRACQYGHVGSWYGRRKRISGSGAAIYHVLRGEFESYWYGGRGDVRMLAKKHKGKKAVAAKSGSSGNVARRQKIIVA